MSHLHAEGVVHKDLAARNVLLTENDACKISDLGLSRVLNSETQEHTVRTIWLNQHSKHKRKKKKYIF